jgi:hypothetical protein
MDTDRRRLEREAAAGDLDAAARALQTRIRSGELSEERVRLAGYLGDPAAEHLCQPRPPLRSWFDGLEAFDHESRVRVCLALAEACVALAWEGFSPAPGSDLALLQSNLRLIRSCLGGTHDPSLAMGAAQAAGMVTASTSGKRWGAAEAVHWAALALARGDSDVGSVRSLREVTTHATRVLGVKAARLRICDELIPWALGTFA